MKEPDVEDGVTTFEKSLREWGRRPPRTAAAVARTRVVAHLPEPARPRSAFRLLAAAALVVLLAVAVWRGSPRPAGGTAPGTPAAFVPSLDANVMVWVIDSRTTVYFVLDKEIVSKGGVS